MRGSAADLFGLHSDIGPAPAYLVWTPCTELGNGLWVIVDWPRTAPSRLA